MKILYIISFLMGLCISAQSEELKKWKYSDYLLYPNSLKNKVLIPNSLLLNLYKSKEEGNIHNAVFENYSKSYYSGYVTALIQKYAHERVLYKSAKTLPKGFQNGYQYAIDTKVNASAENMKAAGFEIVSIALEGVFKNRNEGYTFVYKGSAEKIYGEMSNELKSVTEKKIVNGVLIKGWVSQPFWYTESFSTHNYTRIFIPIKTSTQASQ